MFSVKIKIGALLVLAFFGISVLSLHSQELTQTFRGRVLDKYTEQPLPGATVIITSFEPVKGTVTGIDGEFRFDKLPLGRLSAKVTMIGYNPAILDNMLLGSSHELVLEINLEEQVYTINEVMVRPAERKDQAINEMAVVSARSFTIDETERYAGSLGDPSRMATNYAGVSSASDQRNDIIIRGNSPLGLLWRLEGLEIPNPNHFGTLGSTGGPISMLNNNQLSNSDFYTSAFPAEYGNALAGVFDLKMRSGNNQKHEFMGQVGFNGFELGGEGPFSANKKASYLVNFRYSTLELLKAAGMDFGTGSAVPKYKDLSFKMNFPTKHGKMSIFGIGGTNNIAMLDSEGGDAQYGFSGTDLYNNNMMGVFGINHVHHINTSAHITSIVAVSGIDTEVRLYELGDEIETEAVSEEMYEVKYTISSKYSKKFSSSNYLNTGFTADFYNVFYRGLEYEKWLQDYYKYLDASGNTGMGRIYAEWQHRFSNELTINTGVHGSYFFLNGSKAVEPRLGLKWKFTEKQSLNFGTGLHSQIQMKGVYFNQAIIDTTNKVYSRTNEDLDLTRSIHFVAGYDLLLGQEHRLKAEVYYQKIYDAPVASQRPEFSLISQGSGFSFLVYDDMQNTGTGENKGVELTLEKFLHNGFYYLLTASLFDSGYRGYDGIWRNSAFSNNFVINALSGYEWKLGSKSLLALDLKMVYAGGNRYLEIDEEKSRMRDGVWYKWDQAYEKRYPDYFRLNGRITFRLNRSRMHHEWALDLQNMTNHRNVFVQNWNNEAEELSTAYQMSFMPMVTYRIYF